MIDDLVVDKSPYDPQHYYHVVGDQSTIFLQLLAVGSRTGLRLDQSRRPISDSSATGCN